MPVPLMAAGFLSRYCSCALCLNFSPGRLMQASLEHMAKDFNASTCALHVRAGNRAALGLYRQGLGFLVAKTEQRYYGDGEDALCMQTTLGSA